jgi:hypothetical protein
MKYFLFTLVITCYLFSCKNQTANNDAAAAGSHDTSAIAGDSSSARTDTSASAKSFFPVSDFIGGQVHLADSFQMPLTKSVTINKKTITTSLSEAEFHALAMAFRKPDINDPSLKKFYTESSYEDKSLESVILSYASSNPALEIQKIDVIVKPNPVGDKVKTIYIEKQWKAGDTTVRQKLYWKASHNFQLITEKQVNNTRLPAELVKVVWDPTE